MTDSDQGVRIPEPPGDDPKNYSEGAKSYVKKVAEDGEDKGKKKSLEDPGTEVEASEPEGGPCKEAVTPIPKIDNKCTEKESEPVEDEESGEKSPDDAKQDAKEASKSDKKNLEAAKERGPKNLEASKKGDSNRTNDKEDEGNSRDLSPEPEEKEDVEKPRTGTPRRSPRLKRKNREDGIDDIAIQSSLSSTSKKARQKMEERTSSVKSKNKNKRKLGVSDGDDVKRKAAKKTPEESEASAATARDWMTDDEGGDEDNDDDKTDTVDWGHVESPLRLPKISEIATTPPRSAQSKPEESGASASPSTQRPLVSSLASPSIDQKRVVEIVDAAAFAADKERRADRARKLLEAFDDE